MITQLEKDREAKYLQIITELNRQNRQRDSGVFDCEELGLVHIYWSGNRWECEWLTISTEFREMKEMRECKVRQSPTQGQKKP